MTWLMIDLIVWCCSDQLIHLKPNVFCALLYKSNSISFRMTPSTRLGGVIECIVISGLIFVHIQWISYMCVIRSIFKYLLVPICKLLSAWLYVSVTPHFLIIARPPQSRKTRHCLGHKAKAHPHGADPSLISPKKVTNVYFALRFQTR